MVLFQRFIFGTIFKMNVNSVAACVRSFLFDTSFRYVQQY